MNARICKDVDPNRKEFLSPLILVETIPRLCHLPVPVSLKILLK